MSLLLLAIGPLSSMSAPTDLPPPTRATRYVPHDPFFIDGDAEFAAMATSESWQGSGSYGDPYVIEGFEIEAPGENFAIRIENTLVHFIIRDCLIHNTTGTNDYSGEGIHFAYLENGTVEGSVLINNKLRGLYAHQCKYIKVINCTTTGSTEGTGLYFNSCQELVVRNVSSSGNDQEGLRLSSSSRGWIENCSFYDNRYDGITIDGSTDLIIARNLISDNRNDGVMISGGSVRNDFDSNVFLNCSFRIGGDEEEAFTSNHIPVTNTVNGQPVYQLKDDDGEGQVFQVGGGQLILGNITDLVLENISVHRGSVGIMLGFCDHIEVRDCNLSRNFFGIGMSYCDNLTVTGCDLTECSGYGAGADSSSNISITNSDADGCEIGVGVFNSERIMVHENSMDGCNCSILSMSSADCSLSDNSMMDVRSCGIDVGDSDGFDIAGNRITGAGSYIENGHGIGAYYCTDLSISNNFLRYDHIGMSLKEVSRSNIRNNTVDRSYDIGINITDCSNNTFEGNLLFMSSHLGMAVLNDSIGSRDNLFFFNSFLYNNGSGTVFDPSKVQAIDGEGDNSWTNGTAELGNHWKDWTTPDMDVDGIVDLPYQLVGGASDTAPLAENRLLLVTPPTNVVAKAGRTEVNVSWEPPEFSRSGEVSKYRIYREELGNSTPFLQELPGSVRSYLDNDVDNSRTYVFRLSAVNVYGEGAKSAGVQATPDNEAPEVTVLDPSEGAMVNTSDLRVEWTGSDNVLISYYDHRLDGSNWTDVGMTDNTSLTDLDEGLHEFEVRAHDTMDNTGNATVHFTVDLVPPVVTISSPADGSVLDTNFVHIEWEGADEVSGIAGYSTSLDGGDIDPYNSTDTWLHDLSEGGHTFEVTAIDMVGHSASTVVNFIVDTDPPVVLIISPVEGSELMGSQAAAEWSGNGTGSPISWYETKLDGSDWTGRGTNTSLLLTGLGNGNHTFWVRAVDSALNTAESSVSFRIISGGTVKKVTITGWVFDENGDPIDGAKVRSDTGEVVYTDSEGYFTIEVPQGQRRITISKDGFKTYSRNVLAEGDALVDLGQIAMTEKESNGLWYRTPLAVCMMCCLIPIVIFLVLLFIGAIARTRRYRRARTEE